MNKAPTITVGKLSQLLDSNVKLTLNFDQDYNDTKCNDLQTQLKQNKHIFVELSAIQKTRN